MNSDYVLANVAAERQRTLREEADRGRLAKAARPSRRKRRNPGPGAQPGPRAVRLAGRPDVTTGSRVVLRDGSSVFIRPVRRSDAALLVDGFARLSVASRRLRFLIGKNELTRAELRFFTDVDHHHHEALGAVNPLDGRGVGVARFVRDAHDPQVAELAITVIDDWQGRGLGTELLTQLSGRAAQEGIRRFTALVSADNVAVTRLLRRAPFSADVVAVESDTVEYEIELMSSSA